MLYAQNAKERMWSEKAGRILNLVLCSCFTAKIVSESLQGED